MRIFNIINHLEPNKRKALVEMLRFVLVGGTATVLQYAIYIVALLEEQRKSERTTLFLLF